MLLELFLVFIFTGNVEVYYDNPTEQVTTTTTIFNEGQHEEL